MIAKNLLKVDVRKNFLEIIKKGSKEKARQNNTINFGIISESEFDQGVIIIVIKPVNQTT